MDELDATVQLTRFGGRSLLDGGSEIVAHKSINAAGVKTDYFTQDGEVAGDQTGVQGVRVNQIGFGAPLRFLDDGSAVVSLNVLIGSLDRARRPALGITQGTAGSFAEFRLTGKFGTTTLRLVSTETNLNQAVVADTFTKDTEFNLQAQDTGLILVPDVFAGAVPTITTLGFGDDDFVQKFSYIDRNVDRNYRVVSVNY